MSKKEEALEVEIVKDKKTRVRLDNRQWKEIQMEWCFKGTSYRALAEKWGIGKNTIEKRSIKEDWALYKLTNKVERTTSILSYSSDMVQSYRELLTIFKEDITREKLSQMEWKDKKILVECLKLADCEVLRHLMISDE